MAEERKTTFSKTFEVTFLVLFAIVGLLIALAIWSTRAAGLSQNEYNELVKRMDENRQELKAEINNLQNQMNNSFNTVYQNQDKIINRIDAVRTELNTKLDRINLTPRQAQDQNQ